MTFKEFALQDANTLEATQTMLETRLVDRFPLNDQEVLLPTPPQGRRRLGRRLRSGVRAVSRCCPASSPTSSRSPRSGASPTEPERYAHAARQHDGRDAGVLRRDRAARGRGRDRPTCDRFPLDDLPERRAQPAASPLLDDPGVVPRRGVAPAARPRQRIGEFRLLHRSRCHDRRHSSCGPTAGSTSTRGEVRSPAVDRRRGQPHRRGRPAGVPSPAPPRSTSATSRCCPGLMDMELNLLSAGPRRRPGLPLPMHGVQDDPVVPDAAGDAQRPHDPAGRLHDRAQPRADGEDRRLPARRRAATRHRPGLGRRTADHPRRARHHADRRSPRPDHVPAAGARDHAAERRGGHRQRRARGARVRALPDQARRQGHQDLGVGRRHVAQQRGPGAQQYSDEELAAIVDEAHRAGIRVAAHADGDARHPGVHPRRRRLHRARLARRATTRSS